MIADEVLWLRRLAMRFAVSVLFLAGAFSGNAQIPAERMRRVFPPDIIAGDNGVRVRVETDNETTRVLRITLDGAHQIPRLADHAGVLVCLTDCHLSFSGGEELHLAAGQTRWMGEGRRAARNISNAAVEMLYIESKKPRG
jgi:hypothetical protein